MLEPEAFPEQVEHWLYGSTNANGDCYLAMLIPLEEEWYDVPFPPEVEWLQASSSGPYAIQNETGTFLFSSTTLYPTFYVYYSDLDQDGIEESVESQIAEKFKPVLIKSTNVSHPELQQGLSDFDYTIHNYVDKYKRKTISGNYEYSPAGIENAHYWGSNWCSHGATYTSIFNRTKYWFDLQDSKRYLAASSQKPLYYHVYKDASYYYVQYWYWFNMNDISSQTNNNTWHEGDWEHISIRLSKNGSDYIPDKINLYQHEGGHTKSAFGQGKWVLNADNPNFLDLKNGYNPTSHPDYSHPLIVIAANSHASYFHCDALYHIEISPYDIYVADVFQDEVYYTLNASTPTFDYDVLVKLGEGGQVQGATFHGIYFVTHAIEPRSDFKEWLGFEGYCGDWWRNFISGTPSPLVPSKGGISHEWKAFTDDNYDWYGFGNRGNAHKTITWRYP